MPQKSGQYSNIRIPPESTGPKILNIEDVVIDISSVSGTFGVGVRWEFVGNTSGITGSVRRVNSQGAGSATLYTRVFETSPVRSFTNGETITFSADGQTDITGTLTSAEKINANASVLVSGDNFYNIQRVDNKGGAFVRFGEGETQFDASGLTRVASPEILADFSFHYGLDTQNLSPITSGNGAISHDPTTNTALLTTGGTATGDGCIYESDVYYPYVPGKGRLLSGAISLGNPSASNVFASFGTYDENNGLYFSVEDGILYTTIRSNSTGSVVEEKVPQSEFNQDPLDGTGLSGVDLDTSFITVYWIDYQWHGGGAVRFGIYAPDGARIVAHKFENGNDSSLPYMAESDLPFRVEIKNTGPASQPNTLRMTSASLVVDGSLQPFAEQARSVPFAYVMPSSVGPIGAATEEYALSFRAAAFLDGTSFVNRKLVAPNNFDFFCLNQKMIIRVYVGTTLTGESWVGGFTGSAIETDTSATGFSGGQLIETVFLNEGATTRDAPKAFQSLSKALHTNSSGDAGRIYTVTAEPFDSTSTDGEFRMGVSWLEF